MASASRTCLAADGTSASHNCLAADGTSARQSWAREQRHAGILIRPGLAREFRQLLLTRLQLSL
jgi:hypothetical protein